MRAVLLVAALAVACGPGDDSEGVPMDSTPAPSGDITTSPPANTPPPTPVTVADVSGTWNYQVMAADRDTVLTTGQMVFSADGMSVTQTSTSGGEPAEGTVTLSGGEVNTTVGPYTSYLRPGVTVTTNSTFRLESGRLVGTATAHYAGVTTIDSVLRVRVTMSRVP